MNKFTLLLSLLLVTPLIACETVDLSEQITLDFEASNLEIILDESNQYNDIVDFQWSLKNQSEQILSSEDYELSIRSARPDSYEATLIEIADFSVDPLSETSGTYTYHIDGISSEGEFEFQLVLSELKSDFVKEIETITLPYSLYWGE